MVLSNYENLGIKYIKYRLTTPKDTEQNLYLLQMERALGDYMRVGLFPILQINYSDLEKNDINKLLKFIEKIFIHFSNIISIDNIQHWKIQILAQKSNDILKNGKMISKVVSEVRTFSPKIYQSINIPIREAEAITEFLSNNQLHLEVNLSNLSDGVQLLSPIFLSDEIKNLYSKLPHSLMLLDHVNFFSKDLSLLNDTVVNANYYFSLIVKLLPSLKGMDVGNLLDNIPEGGQLLSGDNGLVTWNEVPKAKYRFFEYAKRLNENILCLDKDIIVSKNHRDDYSVLVGNPTKIITSANTVDYINYDTLFSSNEKRKIILRLKGMTNGIYRIKWRSILDHHNDLIQEWRKFDFINTLNDNELTYLATLTNSQLQMKDIEVGDHRYDLELTVEPNSLIYIHIIHILK